MIRKAKPSDLDALLELESLFPGDTLSRRSFKHFLSKGHADIFVFEETGKVIADAVILYRKGFKSARLYSLVVHPDARSKGVASQLIQHCESAVKAKNCVSLRLELREDNLQALRLYEKLGFKRIDYVSDYYEDHTAALRMCKDLTESCTY